MTLKSFILLSVITLLTINLFAIPKNRTIQISGTAEFLKDGDTVELRVFKYGILNSEPLFRNDYSVKVDKHRFGFKFNGQSYPQYVSLIFKHHAQNDFRCYVVESGQSILLNYKGSEWSISGKNSNSFKIQYALKTMENKMVKDRSDFTEFSIARKYRQIDSGCNSRLKYLIGQKNTVSKSIYEFLYMDTYYAALWTKFYMLNLYGDRYLDSANNPYLKPYIEYTQSIVRTKPGLINDRYKVYSNFYIQYLLERFKVDSCLTVNNPYSIEDAFNFFRKQYKGLLREQVTTTLLCNSTDYSDGLSNSLRKSLAVLKNRDFRKAIIRLENNRGNGATAFDFGLPDENGIIREYRKLKNKAMVLDFWFTGCGGCRELAPFMNEVEKQFNDKPVTFVSISIDKSKNQWLQSIQSGQYTSKNITNLYTNGQGSKHPIISHYQINQFPTLLIIDSKGLIINIKKDPREDKGEQLIKQINECLGSQ